MSSKNFNEIFESKEERDWTKSFDALKRFAIYFSKIKDSLGIEELPNTHIIEKLKEKAGQL